MIFEHKISPHDSSKLYKIYTSGLTMPLINEIRIARRSNLTVLTVIRANRELWNLSYSDIFDRIIEGVQLLDNGDLFTIRQLLGNSWTHLRPSRIEYAETVFRSLIEFKHINNVMMLSNSGGNNDPYVYMRMRV